MVHVLVPPQLPARQLGREQKRGLSKGPVSGTLTET